MSHRRHEDVSKGDESAEENRKDKPPARKTGKRTRSHTDDLGNGRSAEKKARREDPSDETVKLESKRTKSPGKRVSRRSRSSASDDRRSRERKGQEGGSDEENARKTTKSPTRKQSRRTKSSTSDDGRPHERKGGSKESPVEKKPPAGKKRQHSDSDGQEEEKLSKKKTRVPPVAEGASSKSKDDKRQQPVVSSSSSKQFKLIPGMLGKKRIFSESDDQDEGSGKSRASVSGRDDEAPEQLSTPVEKKVPNAKVPGKRAHSDEKENGRLSEKRTALESVRSSREDQTPERLSTPVPVETAGNKTKPPPKVGKRSRSSTEGQSQEDGRPPPEKRAKAAPTMTKTVPPSSGRRRDSKPGETIGKGTENGSRSGNKKRAKSPEIFAHNLKVLRKKSAMRRKKLTKEVKVVKSTCWLCDDVFLYIQLGSNDLSSVLCSRREGDEVCRLLYQINPNKHR